MNNRVFISYAREDGKAIDWLASVLSRNGVEVFMDRENLNPGEAFDIVLEREITNGLRFISVYSRNRAQRTRGYVFEEMNLAIDQIRQRPQNSGWFIPVRLDASEIEDVSFGAGRSLCKIHRCDLFDYPKGINDLLKALGVHAPVIADDEPLAIGYSSMLTIGTSKVDLENGLPQDHAGLRFAVKEGLLFREGENCRLTVRLESPFLDYFPLDGDIELCAFVCNDKMISTHQVTPSEFIANKRHTITKGTSFVAPNGERTHVPEDCDCNLSVQLIGYLENDQLIGNFSVDGVVECLGQKFPAKQSGKFNFSLNKPKDIGFRFL